MGDKQEGIGRFSNDFMFLLFIHDLKSHVVYVCFLNEYLKDIHNSYIANTPGR